MKHVRRSFCRSARNISKLSLAHRQNSFNITSTNAGEVVNDAMEGHGAIPLWKLDNCKKGKKENGEMDGWMTSAAALMTVPLLLSTQESLRLEKRPLKFTSISIGALVEKGGGARRKNCIDHVA